MNGKASAARRDKKMAERKRRCGISSEPKENRTRSGSQRSTDTVAGVLRHEMFALKYGAMVREGT
jgi:hypothetical protein